MKLANKKNFQWTKTDFIKDLSTSKDYSNVNFHRENEKKKKKQWNSRRQEVGKSEGGRVVAIHFPREQLFPLVRQVDATGITVTTMTAQGCSNDYANIVINE